MKKELTVEEKMKLNAAISVCSNSILFGVPADIAFVERILPSHYKVIESKKKGSIHCVSRIGIKLNNYKNSEGNLITDAEDFEHWNFIKQAIKNHFKERFQEIDHNVCFLHKDFTIYLKNIWQQV